ncbi:MAG: site-specific integrase, partial [Bacteroidetes bacterium]|nr:site-specific integrase [Bacteroidota bacterium]
MVHHLENFIDFLSIEQNLAQNTLESYRRDIKRYLEYMREGRGYDNPSQIVQKDISRFVQLLHAFGLGPRSISRNLSAIRTFHKYLMTEEIMKADPAEHVDLPKLPKVLPSVLEIQDMENILKQPDTLTPLGARDRAMLEVLYACGLRISELLTLK